MSDEAAEDRERSFLDEDGNPLSRFWLSQNSDEFLAVSRENPWVLWHLPEGLDVRVRLDFSEERVAVTGIAVLAEQDKGEAPGTVRAGDLRNVPLGRLEDILNDRQLADAIRAARFLGVEGWDFSPTGIADRWGAYDLHAAPPPALNYALRGIEANPKPIEFYIDVASAWSAALANENRDPAGTLAEANGVPVSTVHRWVREARRRHVMAPSSRKAKMKRQESGES